MRIEGKNIILRPFEAEDALFLKEIRQDFRGLKEFAGSPFPSNLDSEREWISHMYPKGDKKEIFLAVDEVLTKEFCGYCVARSINYLNRNAEFGIILHKNARGKRLSKEILYIFFNYLFSEINLHKIYSLVLQSNKIAMEIYKDMGFQVEGSIKEQIYQDGIYKDVYFISLYKQEFFNNYNKFIGL